MRLFLDLQAAAFEFAGVIHLNREARVRCACIVCDLHGIYPGNAGQDVAVPLPASCRACLPQGAI